MTSKDDILQKTKSFILAEFLQGEDPEALTPDTPLFTTGILDSIATLKLVMFLEKNFSVTMEAHEADAQSLNSLSQITDLVASKLSS